MKWLEHEFEIDRDVAQGVGFEFWRKRNGVTAESMSANMFGATPGGWLTAKGTPNGLRALAGEAFVGLRELLRLEQAIADHAGKPVKFVDRDPASSYWYPVCVAVGTDEDERGEYVPDDYAVSADGETAVAIRFGSSLIFSASNDTVEVHTFGGFSADADENLQAAAEQADRLFHELAATHALEVKPETAWGTAYQPDPQEQARIDAAVARLKQTA